ncbi:helix-turn-helix domain-containing protein [Aequorivita echinoideorum]|uniref:Helix-turn-helix domain containing protein n=1 Tax=Aequorivita echinoideorum TaxID=1549647 RepID=A0ABS5S0G6_9FLAO|nr:helix-turn-helix domain-containing protein [Aequorivita echinoideorum]MBT0606692.1 helix-turn-helix domain containing protein [Aequorivita echinoideorum]
MIKRLKKELKIKKDKDLCQLLDIKHNTLSTWKKRDTLDFNKVLALCEERNLDLNYIFFEEEFEEEKPGTEVNETPSEKTISIIPQPLLASKLINTNRNIALFVDEVPSQNGGNNARIILGQQVSTKKISTDILYIVQTKSDKIFVDQLVEIVNSSNKSNSYSLKSNSKTINVSDIETIWQVLDESADIETFFNKN